jgi:hypothetical protein
MRSLTSATKTLAWICTFTLLAGAAAPGVTAAEAADRPVRLVSPWLAPQAGLAGQRASAPDSQSARTIFDRDFEQQSTPRLAAAGLLGAGIGIAAGRGAGELALSDCRHDMCGLGAALMFLTVAGAGTSTLAPLGVHMANGRKGNYGWSLAASTAIMASGLVLTAALFEQSPTLAQATLVSIPVLQVVSSILIERKTAARRHARRNR